jgi:hypothetical protein
MRTLIPALLLAFQGTAGAEQLTPEERAPAPPPIPEDVAREQVPVEDEVIIRPTPEGKIEEYRRNGRLYMVRVVPFVGPAYYLVDTTGDGLLDSRRHGLAPEVVVPHWLLFQW